MCPNDSQEFLRNLKTGWHKVGASVHELKHAAKLQEWSAKVAECRGSGSGVNAWCAEHGISPKTYYSWERQIVKEATEKYALPAPGQSNLLVQVNPDAMPGNDTGAAWSAITIRHGESAITLPAGSSVEAVAELVKALNRHV